MVQPEDDSEMAEPSENARRALLGRACRLIRDADIEAHTICIDPGYPGYVERLVAVRRSNGESGVDQTDWEPIFHATHDDPDPNETEAQRRFRLFTAAIGILHPLCAELLAANPLAITLVEFASAEPSWAAEVYAALDELRDSLRFYYEDEAPFASLACLLIACRSNLEDVDLPALADRVFEDESRHHGRHRPKHGFLWSCTNHRKAFPRWKQRVEEDLPDTPQLAPLRNALLRL